MNGLVRVRLLLVVLPGAPACKEAESAGTSGAHQLHLKGQLRPRQEASTNSARLPGRSLPLSMLKPENMLTLPTRLRETS